MDTHGLHSSAHGSHGRALSGSASACLVIWDQLPQTGAKPSYAGGGALYIANGNVSIVSTIFKSNNAV